MKKLLLIFAFASLLVGQVRIPGPGGAPAGAPPAGITVNELTQSAVESTSNPATSASITPTANAQVFVALIVSQSSGSTEDNVTVTGGNLTWAQVTSVEYGTRRRLFIWRGVGASPTTGALSFQYFGPSFQSFMWSVDEFTGVNATTPLESTAGGPVGGATAVTINITATAPDAGDWVYAAFGVENTGVSATINSELSNVLSNVEGGTGIRTIVAAYDSTPDANPSPGITWTGAASGAGLGFILNVAP